ncbi:hypothetical protein Tco_1506272 [Tanacetum coccineum]
MAGALPSDMVKNPKLNVNSTSLPKEDEQEEKGNLENTNTVECKEEQRDTPQPELKDPTDIDKIVTSRNDEKREIEWVDVEEPLDLVDTCEESIYESLIREMPKCLLNYDCRIKKGDPRNLKIPYMIGHKFTANAYINVDLPMNIMSLAYYNSIIKSGYEYRGRNFVGLGRDMHIFVGNMSYVMDFTILENIETNIDPSLSHVVFGRPFVEIACLAINRKHGLMTFTDGIKEITFKTPYKDPERSELSSEGHDLLSSRIILSEDDYDRGCRKPSDLEDGFYRDTIKLGPEYVTGIADEGEDTCVRMVFVAFSGALVYKMLDVNDVHWSPNFARLLLQTTHVEVVLSYLVLLYYEVTLPDIFPLQPILGVLQIGIRARYVVPTGRVVVPTGRYVVSAGKVIIIVSPGRLSLVPTGRVLSPGSKDLSRFPYLKKDEYEVWAMKMEYWITNNDLNIWKVIQNGNSLKRTGRDHDGRVIILPPMTADEHIAVQRESKARTTLL